LRRIICHTGLTVLSPDIRKLSAEDEYPQNCYSQSTVRYALHSDIFAQRTAAGHAFLKTHLSVSQTIGNIQMNPIGYTITFSFCDVLSERTCSAMSSLSKRNIIQGNIISSGPSVSCKLRGEDKIALNSEGFISGW